MSKGFASFSSLEYLHNGLQETAQRQVDEFEHQIQSHFDWLLSFETSNKPESTVYVRPTCSSCFLPLRAPLPLLSLLKLRSNHPTLSNLSYFHLFGLETDLAPPLDLRLPTSHKLPLSRASTTNHRPKDLLSRSLILHPYVSGDHTFNALD